MKHTAFSQSIIFLGANTPWVYALAEALAVQGQRVAAISISDARTYRRLSPRWPAREKPANLHREYWVYPPGYAGALAAVFGPFLRSRLGRVMARLGSPESSSSSPWVVVAYPWFVHALRDVPNDKLIYYNLDDYALYRPLRTAHILRQEGELIDRAALTLCLSRRQVQSLRERFPERAERIQHFPLGVVEDLINPDPTHVPDGRAVGYVGNLTDRVDWQLVYEVARSLTDVEFRIVGGQEDDTQNRAPLKWQRDRTAALALPNVIQCGQRSQDNIGRDYRSVSVNWIPYATGHAFNIASCPTKIMDGLASGRPLLCTDLPECQQYPEWISIVRSPAEAVSQIRSHLESVSSAAAIHSSRKQVEFVRNRHTWSKRAEVLAGWLSQASTCQ